MQPPSIAGSAILAQYCRPSCRRGAAAAQVSLLTKDQTREILVTWNATDAIYPRDLLIQRVFEQQAELTPDAVAVVGETASLTYSELNEKANQLARFLQVGSCPW
jgi:non-ribosomal peptide synthetase component F